MENHLSINDRHGIMPYSEEGINTKEKTRMFKPIDRKTWKREPYFEHYFNQVRCTYSITVNIDISELISFKDRHKTKLYPLLIYVLTKAVNNHEEFRTAINDNGVLGVWETLHPNYTVFHKEDESFSSIWTEWDDNILSFIANYERDIKLFGRNYGLDAKPNTPANTFPVSSLPWTAFTGFNLNIFADGSYLMPIFTYGKFFQQDGKYLIPLSIQVHHAVCDGFHVSRLINEIQQTCKGIGM